MILTLCAYALTVVLTSAVMALYGFPFFSILTPLIMFCVLIIFGLCSFANKHRKIGGLLVILSIAALIMLISYLSRRGMTQADISFWDWVLTGADENQDAWIYIFTILIEASVFLGFIVYYFAIVLYRISFLTLVSLLPCVLYIKVMREMNDWYLIAIAILSVCIHVVHGMPQRVHKNSAKKGIFFSVSIVIFAVMSVASMAPKGEEALFYDIFQDLFLNGDTKSPLSGDYGNLGEYSGNADNYKSISNRKMYAIYGLGYSYLKRQNYDLYDFEKDRWYGLNDGVKIEPDQWRAMHSKLQLDKLQGAIKTAAEYEPSIISKYGIKKLIDALPISDNSFALSVRSLNFSAVYYLQGSRPIDLVLPDDEDFYVTSSGVFLKTSGSHERNYSYVIHLYGNYTPIEEWVSMDGCNMDSEKTQRMYMELKQILTEKNESCVEYVEAFLAQQEYADLYKENVAENTGEISEEIRRLAEEITNGLTYDWEKAYALQQYFQEGDFIYDIEYVAEDDSPEFFLFESRTGTCSDFATAYVLLARACGLTVRYAEGYAPDDSDSMTYYDVRESDSHAYPEVFLQNVGWVVFEPTVASEDAGAFRFSKLFDNMSMDLRLLGVIILYGIVIFSIAWIFIKFIPFISERLFRLKLRKAPVEEMTRLYYDRLIRKASEEYDTDMNGYTPGEFADYMRALECDIDGFIRLLEGCFYENKPMDEDCRTEIAEYYIKACKFLDAKQKNQKKCDNFVQSGVEN